MVNPTGYTALDMIGFTDQGAYSSSDNYVKNDLVHYSGNIWRCLIDDTSGIAPAEGVNWTLFIGEPTNLVERIIAPVETDPATSAWAVGRQIIFNDNLYEVITAITAGDALVTYEDDPTNANIKLADPVETQLLNLKDNYQSVKLYHNIPRLVPKDVTCYIIDGTFYKRLAGTDGFELFEDLYVGDYIQMSRAISAYEQTQTYQATGSQYATIAGLDTRMGDGDGGDNVSVIDYHHAVMVPGKGFAGTQHFGRSRMNSSNDTTGGYVGSEMFITTIGAVATSGSTATTASINQQLYAEFGSHLKTIRQILSNAMDNTRYNRFGQASGASSGWAWTTVQAVLMSEVEVYGSAVWSSSGFDTGNGNIQLPLFQHNKQAMNNRSAYYWLKDVASSADFCACIGNGSSAYNAASGAYYFVRPRFILA